MKTPFYIIILLFIILILQSNSVVAQDVQREYIDSANYIEVPIIDNSAEEELQALRDSIENAQQEAIYKELLLELTKNNSGTSTVAGRVSCTQDSSDLVALYNATNGPNWDTPWILTEPMSTWEGVSLNENGCVVGLFLYSNNLVGTIPDEIGNLVDLELLILSRGQLSGELPSSMANLTALTNLNLSFQELSGAIPAWIENFSNLDFFHLAYNQFSGAIPTELTTLSNLTYLDLRGNQLTSIPNTIDDLNGLQSIFVGDNPLTSVPSTIGNMTQLTGLGLSDCNLEAFPTWIGDLTELEYLSLSRNGIIEVFPSQLENLTKLTTIYLYGNQFAGDLPIWMGDLTDLEYLDLSNNILYGAVPTSLGNLQNLIVLNLADNDFEDLPDFSSDLAYLNNFYIGGNQFTVEDILPNVSLFEESYHYMYQDNFGTSQTITVQEGDDYMIDFAIDQSITNSTYNWYRNGNLVTTTTTSALPITNIDISKIGAYHCVVSNPGLPDLMLESNKVVVNMEITEVPPNDLCANATVLTMGNMVCSDPSTGYNINATNDEGDSSRPDVWYQVTVPPSGIFELSFTGITTEHYELWYEVYSGDCQSLTNLWGRFMGRYDSYSESLNIAPAGTDLFIKIWYGDNNNDPGIFDICVYEQPCKSASVGFSELISCENDSEFFVDVFLYDFGSGSSLTIKSVNDDVDEIIVNRSDYTGSQTPYRIGPFQIGMEHMLDVLNDQNDICNNRYYIYSSDANGVSNNLPCSAIDISASIGTTYTYTEGDDPNTALSCTPTAPIIGCNQIGGWSGTRNLHSEWFSFTNPGTVGLTLDISASERNYDFKIAIWEATDCNTILDGTPTLVTAMRPCSFVGAGNDLTLSIPCLTPDATYYLQVAGSYLDYTIALNEINLPCDLTNDTSEDAIAIGLSSEACSDLPTYLNVGATDSRNDESAPEFIDNFGSDVWFTTEVPASGTIAVNIISELGDDFSSSIYLFNNSLEYLDNDFIDDQRGKRFFNDLPIGETIYLAIDYRDNSNWSTGYFQVCIVDPPCVQAHVDFTSLLSCTDDNEFFVDAYIYEFGSGNTLTFESVSDAVTPVVVNIADYQDGQTSYRLGPFSKNNSADYEIAIINEQSDFCNDTIGIYPPDVSTVSNVMPCDAIDLTGSIGATYSFEEGDEFNEFGLACLPEVPTSRDSDIGYWRPNGSGGSEWFRFVYPTSGNLSLEFDAAEMVYGFRVAIWEAANCGELTAGTPTLVRASQPNTIGGTDNALTVSIPCLTPNATYYVQVANSHNDYTIALNQIDLPCSLTNDTAYNAINIHVQDETCTDDILAFNIGATDSRYDPNVPVGLENFTDYDEDGYPINNGTDIWFRTKVTASGNLATKITAINDDDFRAIVNIYSGHPDYLDLLDIETIYWEGEEGTLFFKDLPVGDSIYLAIDYRNNDNETGYFQLCVMDPPCSPIHWAVQQPKVNCEDNTTYYQILNIVDKGTTPTYSIVNASDGTVYAGSLTDIGLINVGPFPIGQTPDLRITTDNSFCDSETIHLPALNSEPGNDHMCNAWALNPIINKEQTIYGGSYGNASIEECEPVVPYAACDSGNGWDFEADNSRWNYFSAISNSMKITITKPINEFLAAAIWKAPSCEELKDGTATFVQGIYPCSSEDNIVFDLENLENGARYYLAIYAYTDYTIQIESPTDPLYNDCEEPDLMISGISSDFYNAAANTIGSDATVTSDNPVHFIAGEEITLLPGFEVDANEEFTATIIACELSTIQAEQPVTEQQLKVAPVSTKEVSLQVSPNPLQQQANIRFYLPENTPVKVYVFDSNGQVLTEQSADGQAGWQTTQLDASRLPIGMYFVSLQTAEGVWMERVVVAR